MPSRSTRARRTADALAKKQEASSSASVLKKSSVLKKKSGSKDSPKRARIRRVIQVEEAKPVEDQDQDLLDELHEDVEAPLTDAVAEFGNDSAKKFDRITRKTCGYGSCSKYCIRCPGFIFLTFIWPLLITFYFFFVAHPKFFYCITS